MENGSQDFTFINDASNTRVGINRIDPQYNLDVTGDINLTGTLYQNGMNLILVYGVNLLEMFIVVLEMSVLEQVIQDIN